MNSNQPTPGVKRKIPGPASKTLKRRNCNLEAETCNVKTKCLFCFNIVLISYAAKADTDEDRKRVQLVKNLCNRVMKTNQDELPTVYSPEAFPFCDSCQEHVQRLWEYDEIVRNAQIKIAETMLAIEKEVVNGEVLKSSQGMSMSSTPATPVHDKHFLKLRDAIFTGFRNKLLMKQKLNEKLLEASEKRRSLAQPQATSGSKEQNEHFKKPEMTPIQHEVLEIRDSEKREGQGLSNNPCIKLFASDDDVDNSPTERNGDTCSEDKGDSPYAPVDDITLHVTHTNAVIDDSSGIDTGSSKAGSAELSTSHAKFDSQSIDKEGRNLEGVIMDGLVEIYWTSGSVPDEGYLDCTICSHEIMFSTRKAKGLSHATSKMESHIKNHHQEEKNRIYSTTKTLPLVYSCGACGVVFKDSLARDKHEVVHRTCEICGKQIGRKYNSHNMLLHVNTHKSEAERKAGVKAGEKGYIGKKRYNSKHEIHYS